MQDGLIYSNLLMKMYLMVLKNNGILMLDDHIPHTPQTIATFTRHQIGTVERALKVFMELGLVEVFTNGTYYMTDIQMLIGLSSTEGERKKRERMRLQQENLLPQNVVDICPPMPQDYTDKETGFYIVCHTPKEQQRLDRIRRLKANGLQDKALLAYTFAQDDGTNLAMKYAHRYVKYWTEVKADGQDLLFWGGVGTGKTFAAVRP